MRHNVLTALAVVLVAGTARAQQPTAPQQLPLDRVVAVVGNTPITWYDLQEKLNGERQRGMQLPTDSVALLGVARTVLGQMVDEEVMVQKARELKVEVDEADVTNTVERQMKAVRDRFSGDEAEFRRQLQLAGFGTPEEYRRFLSDEVRRSELQRRLISKLRQDGKLVPAGVSEADIQEAFQRNQATLPKRPASVTFRQIVLNPRPAATAREAARAKAESLLAEIKAGGNFESIARRESMDASRELGGDLGWERPSKYVPEFARWVSALPPGQLSPVVETPFGFHIIRVDRRQPGEVKARHILIKPVVDSQQVTRTRALADSVADLWRKGTPFDSLARRWHDYANDEETSLLTPFPIDSLPASYQQALRGRAPNDIAVFQIPGRTGDAPKFVVAQLLGSIASGDVTLAEVKERIRDQLAEENSFRRLLDSLRKETFVSIRLDELPSGSAGR
jgi:peptidyl-prolyl cis-trans isomerase SurA